MDLMRESACLNACLNSCLNEPFFLVKFVSVCDSFVTQITLLLITCSSSLTPC